MPHLMGGKGGGPAEESHGSSRRAGTSCVRRPLAPPRPQRLPPASLSFCFTPPPPWWAVSGSVPAQAHVGGEKGRGVKMPGSTSLAGAARSRAGARTHPGPTAWAARRAPRAPRAWSSPWRLPRAPPPAEGRIGGTHVQCISLQSASERRQRAAAAARTQQAALASATLLRSSPSGGPPVAAGRVAGWAAVEATAGAPPAERWRQSGGGRWRASGCQPLAQGARRSCWGWCASALDPRAAQSSPAHPPSVSSSPNRGTGPCCTLAIVAEELSVCYSRRRTMGKECVQATRETAGST